AALVLFVVPSWRPLAPVPLGPLIPCAVIWFSTWPDALGGSSVGEPLLLAWFAGLVVLGVITFISTWRSDRRSAFEFLVMGVVLSASVVARDHYFGKDFGWLIEFPPVAAFLAYIFIFRRQRASN